MIKTVILVFIAVIALAAIAFSVVFTFIMRKKPGKLPPGFTVTAHSGCEHTEDNSMEFLEKAIEIKASVLEVDLTFRSDGTPVLIHKNEAADGEGLLFDEALKYISESSDSVKLNLDLKSTAFLPNAVAVVEKYGLRDRCFYTGVTEDFLDAVKKDGGGLPYFLNLNLGFGKRHGKGLYDALKKVKDSSAIGINCNYRSASHSMVGLFHENGLLVSCWTANSKRVMRRLLSVAPDNITTRYPTVLGKMI